MLIVAALVAAAMTSGLAVDADPGPGRSLGHLDASSSPANVVLMVVDDATVADIRYMPNVQSLLVDHGSSFIRNYAPFPACCPARATILTGQYPHNHGVLSNAPPLGGAPAFNDDNTVATYLDPVYETGLVGKYLNAIADYTYIPPGWDDWRVPYPRTTYNYTSQKQNVNGVVTRFSGYLPEIHGREARAFIASVPLDQPFFSYVAWVAPHAGVPHEVYDLSDSPFVSKSYRGTYAGPRLPQDASFNEANVSDKPSFVKDKPVLSLRDIRRIEQRLVQRRESLLAVDHQVGKIVADIAARGQLDSTYFIFTSDNGQMQGEHRIARGKVNAYEPASRVPLVIKGPGFPADYRYHGVTGLQDLTPTVLDLTDQPLPKGAPEPDGVSLLASVTGTVVTNRVQLLEMTDSAGLSDQQVEAGIRLSEPRARALANGGIPWKARGIVTGDNWKYVVYPETGEAEMYDLNTDPDELVNVYGRRAYAAEQSFLSSLLAQYENCAGATCR